MEPELVSIVMPTYNRAGMIGRSIESVLRQTYPNWELIVVDDASTDRTEEVIAAYQNGKIRYVRNERNLKACASRNAGIAMSKGKYITFLDSDDEFMPRKIELQVEKFRTSDVPRLGVVSCGRMDYRDGRKYFEWIPVRRGDILEPLLAKARVGAQTSLLMIRREVIENEGIGFDPEMPAAQDWDFLVGVCQKYNFDFVDQPLVKIHQHNGERVYTNDNAAAAFERQLTKYDSLFRKYPDARKRFVIKYADVLFLGKQREKAIKELSDKDIPFNLTVWLWKQYFKSFEGADTVLSRIALKGLRRITFSDR